MFCKFVYLFRNFLMCTEVNCTTSGKIYSTVLWVRVNTQTLQRGSTSVLVLSEIVSESNRGVGTVGEYGINDIQNQNQKSLLVKRQIDNTTPKGNLDRAISYRCITSALVGTPPSGVFLVF